MITNPAERLAEYNFKSGETPSEINEKNPQSIFLALRIYYISKIPLSAPLAIFSKSSPKSQRRITALAAACCTPILSPCNATAA